MDSGAGLTDSTYLEWIMERTKKIFLILTELGCPEKIFDLIDGSMGAWDDWDLPVAPGSLENTNLGSSVEKRFYKKQYQFLLRDLEAGSHIDYKEEEIIPLETVFKPTTTRGPSVLDKVYYPRNRNTYYSRKRIPIRSDDNPEQLSQIDFLEEVDALKRLTHAHLVSVHASYTHQGNGYIVLSPTIELTLKSFLNYPPSNFKLLPKLKRRSKIFDWMHCLSDAVAYLHDHGIDHNSVKPSSIIIDPSDWSIYLSDIGIASSSSSPNKKPVGSGSCFASIWSSGPSSPVTPEDMETYEYGAPEFWVRTMTSHDTTSNSSTTIVTSGRIKRKQSNLSSTSGSSIRAANPAHDLSPPLQERSNERSVNLGTWATPHNPSHEKAHVFSLGCVFLDILTYHAKRKLTAFSSHRSSKSRRSREAAPPDVSFHANLGQVDSWMEQLEKHAAKKQNQPMMSALVVVREMLNRQPSTRPTIRDTEQSMYRVAMSVGEDEMPHCGMHTAIIGVDPGLALLGGWQTESIAEDSVMESYSTGSGGLDHQLEEKMRRFTTSSSSAGSTVISKNSKGKRSTSFGAIFHISRNDD